MDNQPIHADINLAPDDEYDDIELVPPETPAGKKKGGFPPFLKYLIIGFVALVVLLIGLYAFVLLKKSKAAGEDEMSGGVAMQTPVAAQVPQPPMNAPVPVYGNGAPQQAPQMAPAQAPQMAQPAPTPMQAPVQAAQSPSGNGPAAPEHAVNAPSQTVPTTASTTPLPPAAVSQAPTTAPNPASAGAMPGTPMQGAGQSQGIDPRSAQTLRDWPRERDEILKRLSAMDTRLEELGRTLKAINDNRASAQPKPETKIEPKPVRKDPPATRPSVKDDETDHKREVAAGVVRGVPRGTTTKQAAQQAKGNGEPVVRRDYYLTGWVGDMAFYTRAAASGREERDGSAKPGDMIDGVKVLRIDTQTRRILLEGNQYIGTR